MHGTPDKPPTTGSRRCMAACRLPSRSRLKPSFDMGGLMENWSPSCRNRWAPRCDILRLPPLTQLSASHIGASTPVCSRHASHAHAEGEHRVVDLRSYTEYSSTAAEKRRAKVASGYMHARDVASLVLHQKLNLRWPRWEIRLPASRRWKHDGRPIELRSRQTLSNAFSADDCGIA
ncbi:hypothetical protein BU16DRAFT_220785 [Lophium mytilinum]|uniref:Uncharacterized protein n=1 Tax=Lophium mytilinum TaxID=390894 RepID=A0A6A6QBI7_9PEZI|nr:hypothetical protein BU16DRAFT_220785 [Lophium mytilinum]